MHQLLKIENLSFSYPNSPQLINDFNLTISGPQRIAITGANGCGKSTLIKLICEKLMLQAGSIYLGVQQVAYLDQAVSMLDTKLNLIENFLNLNPNAKPFDAYHALAAFKFRNKAAEQPAATLSGGERMRAGLAISLMSLTPPQLILLDEPTNHLDLQSIETVERILNEYQGAILAVSHDDAFLKNIQINKEYKLKK